MIDYAQSFDDFASSLNPTNLALYAGAAIVLWVLFKEKLNPINELVKKVFVRAKELVESKKSPVSYSPVIVTDKIKEKNKEDVFFDLIVSWKKTRDLAVSAGCEEAVKVADQMFPFLSPNVCKSEDYVE